MARREKKRLNNSRKHWYVGRPSYRCCDGQLRDRIIEGKWNGDRLITIYSNKGSRQDIGRNFEAPR